jgi:Ras family protein
MERMISYEEGKKLAEDWNAIFLETSAKQTASASEIFHALLMEMEKIDGILGDRPNCIIS